MNATLAGISGGSTPYPISRAGPPVGGAALVHLARLAARTLQAPAALVLGPALPNPIFTTPAGADLDAEEARINPNTRAICDYVTASGQPLLLGDLSSNFVEPAPGGLEGGIVAYAGIPLRSAVGIPVAALCIVDNRPRAWSAADLDALREFAGAFEAVPPFSCDSRLEIQFRQSLKLEAVGRLAGGIAHDFNNILTAIRGHADLLLDEIAAVDPRRLDLEEIRRCTERAALLTHQLLAFGRKQILQPRSLDLGTLLPTWAVEYRASLSDDVALQLDVAPGIATIRGDPGQLELALRSLVANAAEALPRGGSIAISAANANLDENFVKSFPYRVLPGPYVRIMVVDNGVGMDEKTLERIFEPFFTTREPPQGAGLGLSTVYGIVKQSGGYIWAESTVGLGTSIKIYLPRPAG
jgi:signal transduction histidine kinase